MKARIGVDADSGLVHAVIGTAANANDVTQVHCLLHGAETVVFADAGYQGVDLPGISKPTIPVRRPISGVYRTSVIPACFAALTSNVIVCSQPADVAVHAIRQSAKSAFPASKIRIAR